MPELPEVETIIRGLARRVLNRRITSAEFRFPQLVVGDPDEAARRLRGSTITGIHRHGKYIVLGSNWSNAKRCPASSFTFA